MGLALQFGDGPIQRNFAPQRPLAALSFLVHKDVTALPASPVNDTSTHSFQAHPGHSGRWRLTCTPREAATAMPPIRAAGTIQNNKPGD